MRKRGDSYEDRCYILKTFVPMAGKKQDGKILDSRIFLRVHSGFSLFFKNRRIVNLNSPGHEDFYRCTESYKQCTLCINTDHSTFQTYVY